MKNLLKMFQKMLCKMGFHSYMTYEDTSDGKIMVVCKHRGCDFYSEVYREDRW